MTIAAGFHCIDGVVLSVDSQYSGGVSKTQGQKLFPIHQGNQYSVTVAGAGHVGMMKRTVQKFTNSLEENIGDKPTTLEEIQNLLESALCETHAKHIYPAPLNERQIIDFWFLMAAWTTGEGHALFRTDLTAVTAISPGHGTCIGIGSYLGEYLVDLLCSPGMDVEDGKPVAAYIAKSAKEYVNECGKSTFMRVLRYDGIDERIVQDEIQNAEDYFEDFFSSMRHLLGYLNVGARPGDLEASVGSLFAQGINGFREKQKVYRDAVRARRREFSRLKAPPNPPSPTGDPLSLPPLPESPGGSSES